MVRINDYQRNPIDIQKRLGTHGVLLLKSGKAHELVQPGRDQVHDAQVYAHHISTSISRYFSLPINHSSAVVKHMNFAAAVAFACALFHSLPIARKQISSLHWHSFC